MGSLAYIPHSAEGMFRMFEVYNNKEATKLHVSSSCLERLIDELKYTIERGLKDTQVEPAAVLGSS